ncbi:MAG: PqqD family protein [Elusimicrobia bacterium]|nr:PqqD family protein [Elusimicrobiota bacterium]
MSKDPRQEETFRHSPDTAWRRVEDDAVVLDLRSGVYFSLNDTAARMWELLGEGLDAAEVAEQVSEEYGQELSEVRADLGGLVRQLRKEGLLLPSSPA